MRKRDPDTTPIEFNELPDCGNLMLNLKPTEHLMIGSVELYLIGIRRGIVRLAIRAPKSIPISRRKMIENG